MTAPTAFTRGRPRLWPVSLREAGLVLLAAGILASVNWLAGAAKLPLRADPAVYELELAVPLVEIPEALALFTQGAHLFIDTRAGVPQAGDTIAGAFVIREGSFDDDLLALFDDLYPEDPVILFGNGDLVGTNNIANRLLERGFSDVRILRGGLQGWRGAGGRLGSPYLPEGFPAGEGEGAS